MTRIIRRSVAMLAIALPFIGPIEVAAQQAVQGENEKGPDEDTLKAIIIKGALDIIIENIKASNRESGEIDKLIRALSGISIMDIKKYGICGGPNSEARKLAASLCAPIK